MIGRHLVAVHLDRLATINPRQQPTATTQEGRVGNSEQRHADLFGLHTQHHAALEMRKEWAEQGSLGTACGSDDS